jgi:prepilin-type N-terminal cleavage/methylation domain-containing protein
MRNRRGFSLVELLITMVVLGIVTASLGRILLQTFRVSESQLVQADLQSNVRTGGLILPLEFREIGYDSNITTGAVTPDIEAMATNEIQFRAMRGYSTTCGTPSLNEIRFRKPVTGLRLPLMTDGFLLYVENDENTGIDDQWIPLTVTAINPNGLCGADSAVVLTINTPQVAPGVNLTLASIFVGGPVRYFERIRFGTFVDTDGLTYVGARSVSAGEADFRALVGPLSAANGLQFRYFARNGTALDPATANPAAVRSVQVTIRGLGRQAINLAGSANRQRAGMTTTTIVALRNTLNH